MSESVATMLVSPTFGSFFFDAVFNTDHFASLTVTQHPVQSGASISDHAFMEPDEVSIEIGMSDAASGALDSHSVNAYTQLRAIMELREPVTLITRLKTYSSMVITSISAPDDVKTMYALRATISFRKVNIVNVSTVTVQETVTSSKTATEGNATAGSHSSKGRSSKNSGDSSAKTSSTTKTTKATSEPSTSVLKKLSKALGL